MGRERILAVDVHYHVNWGRSLAKEEREDERNKTNPTREKSSKTTQTHKTCRPLELFFVVDLFDSWSARCSLSPFFSRYNNGCVLSSIERVCVLLTARTGRPFSLSLSPNTHTDTHRLAGDIYDRCVYNIFFSHSLTSKPHFFGMWFN